MQREVRLVRTGSLTELGETVAQQTVQEDDDTEERRKNWHFYDRFRASGEGRLGHWLATMLEGEASLHPLYASLGDRLDAALAEEDSTREAFLLLGRMLHYLQDMAVPAHVVPVFHPRFLIERDEVDAYPFDPQIVPAIDCARVKSDARRLAVKTDSAEAFFRELLEESAQRTWRPFVDPSSDPHPVPWTCYWEPDPRGFGAYERLFGELELSCGGKNYALRKSDNDSFIARRHAQAIHTSAVAIFYLLDATRDSR